MHWVILLATAISLTSCLIYLPVESPEPFEKQPEIIVGSTNSKQVVSLIGQPQMRLDQQTIWVYGRCRITGKDPDGHILCSDYLSIIEFANDVVMYKEKLKSFGGDPSCWSNQICIDPKWISEGSKGGPRKIDKRLSAVFSLREDDKQAKLFDRKKGVCSIYVYKAFKLILPQIVPLVSFREIKDEPVSRYGYLNFHTPPGQHKIIIDKQPHEFECTGNDLVFISISKAIGGGAQIELIAEKEGRKAVEGKNLLITW
jgi:hypothetical protein